MKLPILIITVALLCTAIQLSIPGSADKRVAAKWEWIR